MANTETLCVQGGWQPKNGEPRVLPIYQSTTFKYETTNDMADLFDLKASGYFYTRLQNPTNDAVASKIAALEGGVAAMLTSSGQAANFYAVFNICESGDHFISTSAIYGGTSNLFSVTMKKLGIECTFVDQDASDEEIEKAFRPNTKCFFGETVANPAGKILDLEHDNLYNKYMEKVGTIVTAEVYQVWKREVLVVDEDNNELILPKSEQIPNDQYRKGETIRAVILRVDNENNNPKIILSRTSPMFLERLLEAEVPEIEDGLITIRRVARMPGERAKIAVESYDERIDPVGACVGVKGSRVHGIVRELGNENIDVINFTTNTKLFIQRALSPAQVSSITIDEENHKAEVYLRPEEVSLAIGRGGLNIKLASMLTEYTIDVFREVSESEADEDIYLDEFADEIDEWVIESIKKIGLDTAKAVLNAPREMLVEKADLEEETVDHLLEVLRAEFEEPEAPQAPEAPEE